MGFDNECILNIQSLPGEYFCPVCRTLVYPSEALQAQCTHLYCKQCLAYVVATTHACPYDGYLVTEADSKPLIESNKSVADAINMIQVHCLYHRSGCQWQGSLLECITHCTSCNFGNSPVVCNRCGTQIVHRQVQEHAQICPGVQPQAQQTEVAPTQASAEQSQAGAQAASQTSQDPSLQNAAASAATSASISVSAPASAPAVASATTAAPAAISGQGNSSTQPQAANTGLTPEQWYQQQQLQYQQYYQQYPGYYPYQQQAQYAQQAYPQYSQPQMQTQTQVMQAPQQPLPYQQSQPQILPQPQPLPQPQAQQVAAAQPATQVQLYGQAQPQSFPQGNPQPHPYGHIPQMQVPANPQQQLPTPVQQSQPQANPPSQLQVPSQSVGHHPPTQPSQVQPSVPLQHQQLVMPHQHGPPQMPQPQSHAQHQPQTHPHVHPRPQLHQLPHMQSQQHPQPPTQPQPQGQQPMHQPPQPQHPAVHAVTGHQSYPQSQPPQQMLPVAQQQRPAYVHPQQQQLPQHPAQMQALLPPQQPQMRPPQSAVPVQAQATMPPPRMGYHPNLTPVQQHPQHHPGVQPPAHHGVPHQPAMGQMHPQHGPFPSQQTGLPPQTLRPQGSLHTQPYAPPQSHVQQNAILTQGAPIHETQPGGGRAEITIHALPSGGQAGSLQPNDSRVQKTDRTESLPDKTSDVKESRSTVVMSELSGMRESEFKPKGNIDNGADDGHDSTTVAAGASVRVKENESLEPSVDQTVKGDMQSEQSAVVTVNNLSDRNSQRMVKAEEEGREEKSISGMNEGEENEKVKLPAIGNAQPLSRESEVAVQKISPFPVKGEQMALPTDKASGLPGPISDRYQNQMIPHGPPDMWHMPSHRLPDSDRMLPQHMPPFGPDHDRSFQGPQYQMQVHGHSHMRPPGGFAENLPPQGQPLGPASFRPEVPPVGFPESGLHRGPGQFGPSSKTLESPGMTSQLPPHGQLPPPRMPHAGPLPGPPFGGPPSGSFDNPGNILAKAPTNAEGSIGMSRPPYPMPDDKFSNRMPGSYDSRFIDSRQPIPPMDLLSGPPRSMVKLNGPLGNIPEPTHGSADRFQGPPEGLKPLLDDRFKSFASDSNRYNTDRRNFEEDSKQFPRHAGLDGEGYPKMENYSSRPQDRILNAWGPERPSQPFGHDGGPKFDSSGTAMASRFRPPHLSDGVFGDWSHHGDTSRKSDFGRYNSDNPPFGMPGRDNIDLPPSRFESNTVFHGPSSQSRFKDFDGGDPHVFGERSRPFNIHSDPLGNSVQGSRLPMSSAPFGDSERSRMIEQYGSAQPRFGEVDGPDFMHGNPAGELFGARMPILGPGSPRGFRNDSLHLGNLPLHLRSKDPGFGGNFQSNVFSSESGLFNSVAFQDDMRSSDPLRKRKPGGAGWCRICKIDCETVEGLDLHSQTREHQKMAMDIVLRIKKNNSKKQKMSSEENNPLDDANKANKIGFESRGNKH